MKLGCPTCKRQDRAADELWQRHGKVAIFNDVSGRYAIIARLDGHLALYCEHPDHPRPIDRMDYRILKGTLTILEGR